MKITLSLIVLLSLVGCGSTRSISNYDGGYNYMYNGELSQLDVLSQFCKPGIQKPTNLDFKFRNGAKTILMQSGKLSPEIRLSSIIGDHLKVVQISGIPSKQGIGGVPWNRVAELGGVDYAICYWGEIETGYTTEGTAAVSWVPIVGAFIPDTAQAMRIKTTIVIVEIETGAWAQIVQFTKESSVSTSIFNRRGEDMEQIEKHKLEMIDLISRGISSRIE